jgi:hypothetical protein
LQERGINHHISIYPSFGLLETVAEFDAVG